MNRADQYNYIHTSCEQVVKHYVEPYQLERANTLCYTTVNVSLGIEGEGLL